MKKCTVNSLITKLTYFAQIILKESFLMRKHQLLED